MTAKCQACKGQAANAYLCGKCVKQLRDNLAELPFWIDRLIESIVGQVRFGDGGTRPARTMHGDDELASHIESLPGCSCDDECTCDPKIARGKRQRAALAHALALGRVNANASELHADIANVLETWIRHLCETRSVTIPKLATTVRMARWLHANVSAIANDEAAGECVDELADIRKRIERTVNRPEPRKFLGKCPTWDEEAQKACGRELSAPADAIEVRCRDCRQTHNCNRLQLLLVNDQEREKVTMARIRYLNRNLPPEYRIPERSLRQWIADGRLKPRGYLRADGSRGITRHSEGDEPLYLWADVRKVRTKVREVKAKVKAAK